MCTFNRLVMNRRNCNFFNLENTLALKGRLCSQHTHTQSYALHNGRDCSRCGCCGNFFVCVVPRSCTLHGNEKHSHAKVKAEERPTVEHTRPAFPPALLLAQNVPTVCSLLKHVCGRGRRTGGGKREKALTHVGARGLSKWDEQVSLCNADLSAETSKRPDSAASVDS